MKRYLNHHQYSLPGMPYILIARRQMLIIACLQRAALISVHITHYVYKQYRISKIFLNSSSYINFFPSHFHLEKILAEHYSSVGENYVKRE
jgi:hypothetical protein